MQFKTWIESGRGRAAGLAEHLKVPASFVSKMVAGEKPIPLRHMAAIESFSGCEVTRQEMCPDDWAVIWPELNMVQPQQTRAQHAPKSVASALPQGV